MSFLGPAVFEVQSTSAGPTSLYKLELRGAAQGASIEGRFTELDARITFDPARAELGHVVVTVDTASAVTGNGEVDQELPRAAWFDAKSFPQATFSVKSFRPKGGHDYDAVGTFKLRNVVKPVTMPVTIEVDGSTLHAKGRLDLVRTDYGVGGAPALSGSPSRWQ